MFTHYSCEWQRRQNRSAGAPGTVCPLLLLRTVPTTKGVAYDDKRRSCTVDGENPMTNKSSEMERSNNKKEPMRSRTWRGKQDENKGTYKNELLKHANNNVDIQQTPCVLCAMPKGERREITTECGVISES